MVVPKIIHQIWIYQDSTKNISWAKKNFSESINSWKSKHPDFDYILWSNSEVHQLIHDYFPEIIPKINQIKSEDIIILADIARLCVSFSEMYSRTSVSIVSPESTSFVKDGFANLRLFQDIHK